MHPLPERHWMPYRSLDDKFIGRVDEIWELHDSLFRDGTTVLQGVGVVAGTGGLGKTQLAIEYAHRFGPVYTGGVYWVNADRGLTEMLTRISAAAGVDLDPMAEEADQLARLWHDLNARHLPCLVILDNLPEDADLWSYLPTTGPLHTIVTTRRQDLDQATVRLPVLSPQESVQLLNSGVRQLGQSTEPLAERLGRLPLALELSKSYLNFRKDLTVLELIKEIDIKGEVGVLRKFATEYRNQLPSRHERDVVSTFELSWLVTPEPAKRILRVMGELAPTTVPKKLLRLILDLPEQSSLDDELSNGLSDLERLSLVELSSNGDPIAHRLILAFARHRTAVDSASPFDRCREALLQQMERAHPAPDANTNRELDSFLPHAEFLVSTDRLSPESFVALLNSVGTHHQTLGRFTAARHALYMALASAEKSFEAGHPSIAISQSNLAIVLKDLGQLEEARDLLRQALASVEKAFEAGHPSIATGQGNLALVLQDLGQLEEARDLLRLALASDERSFEAGHPSIAISQSNLAMVLKDLGQLEEARDLLGLALASAEGSFEAGHPFVAIRQSNLALVLKNLGQMEEARDLLRQCLSSSEKSFEAGHPFIATRQSNLALVLKHLGQMEGARDLLRQALASDETSFEAGHSSIAIRQSNLATVLKDLGQLEEARALMRKSHSTLLERLGPHHPHTKTVAVNLQILAEE